MTDAADDVDRAVLIRTMQVPSSLDELVAAMSVYARTAGSVYVEQFDEGWRWSPAHRGGAYPLLRVVARFLTVDYTRVIVPFRTVPDGWAVLEPEGDSVPAPLASAVLTFDEPATPAEVRRRLEGAFR